MDVVPLFSAKLQKLWNSLELRVLVLFSLVLQIILIATGNRRRYSTKKRVAAVLWLAYLSADSVATLALGVLSQAGGDAKNTADPKFTITALWAPFLLMHLGGPDTITAYALADNELWSRHFLGLLGQVFVAVYVFFRSFTRAHLNFLWLVIFSTGFVKYGERSWVLYSASKDRFRDSMVSRPDPGPDYAKFMDEMVSREEEGYAVSLGKAIDIVPPRDSMVSPPDPVDEMVSREEEGHAVSLGIAIDILQPSPAIDTVPPSAANDGAGKRTPVPDAVLLQKAYRFFGTFKKLFADLILSFQDRETSVSYFKTLRWKEAFRIVEIELGLVFDLLYTKSPFIFTTSGFFLRLFSCSSAVAAFVAFLIIEKGDYPETEVIITYILLVGAIFLEIYAVVLLFRSDRMMIQTYADSTTEEKIPDLDRKRWSNSMGQYNVIEHCLKYMPKKNKRRKERSCPEMFSRCVPCSDPQERFDGCVECFDQFRMKFHQYLHKYLFWRSEPVGNALKVLIFRDLLRRNREDDRKKVDSYWSDKMLRETNCFHEKDEVEFDQSLLIWHIATDLCYHAEKEEEEEGEQSKNMKSKCLHIWHMATNLCYRAKEQSKNMKSKCLLIWHMATNLCYRAKNDEEKEKEKEKEKEEEEKEEEEEEEEEKQLNDIKFKRESCRLLSNYMVHLLIMSPFMLPSGIGQIRFQDTCAEATRFLNYEKTLSEKRVCGMLSRVDARIQPAKVKGDRSKSLLFDARRVAAHLEELEVNERWEKITRAWLDMLTFAAAHCSWSDHAEKLSQGGELLTHVWLLLAHFGMTDQFQIAEGYVRAKLVLK